MRYLEIINEYDNEKITNAEKELELIQQKITTLKDQISQLRGPIVGDITSDEIKNFQNQQRELQKELNLLYAKEINLIYDIRIKKLYRYKHTGINDVRGEKIDLTKYDNNFDIDLKGILKDFDTIKTRCSSILALYSNGKYMFRGNKQSNDVKIFQGNSRDDRRNLDTMSKVANIVNAFLKSNGFIANRTNSIFCTSARGLARAFGTNLYVIFPVNNAAYTWTDFYDFPIKKGVGSTERELIGNEFFYDATDEELMQMIKPKSTDLEKAIEEQKEILISGEYYGIEFDFFEEHKHHLGLS